MLQQLSYQGNWELAIVLVDAKSVSGFESRPDLNCSGVSFATTQAAHDCEYHTLKIQFSSQFKYMKCYLHHIHHSTDSPNLYFLFSVFVHFMSIFGDDGNFWVGKVANIKLHVSVALNIS